MSKTPGVTRRGVEALLRSVSAGICMDTGVGEALLFGLPSPSGSGSVPSTESSKTVCTAPPESALATLTLLYREPVRPVKLILASNCTVNCAPIGSTAPGASRLEAVAVVAMPAAPVKPTFASATVPLTPLPWLPAIDTEPGTMVYWLTAGTAAVV